MTAVRLTPAQAVRAVALREQGLPASDIAVRITADTRVVARFLGDEPEEVEAWPPPLGDDPVYVQVVVRDPATKNGWQRVSARRVRLWGEFAAIDDTGAAYCEGCRAFIDVAVLGQRRSGHRIAHSWNTPAVGRLDPPS